MTRCVEIGCKFSRLVALGLKSAYRSRISSISEPPSPSGNAALRASDSAPRARHLENHVPEQRSV